MRKCSSVEETSVDILIRLDIGADCKTGYTCLGYRINNNPLHCSKATCCHPHVYKNETTANYADKITQTIHEYWLFHELKQQGRFGRPDGLRCRSASACLLGLRVRIPPRTRMCVSLGSVVCCQVDVSATGRSLVQSPTKCVCHWVWSGTTLTLYTYSE